MSQIRKRSSRKQNFSANHEGKHKSINGKRPEQAKQVRLRTIIGMIRGNTSRKRPCEQSEQWLDNEILFPSTLGCQLVDSTVILEALIEGFLVRSQSLKSPEGHWMDRSKKLRSCSLHYPLNDKIPHRQRDCDNDKQEGNSPRMLKDKRSTRTSQGREDHPPSNTSTGFRRNDQPGQKRRSMANEQSRRAR
ncbi:hypothetical protein Tco_0848669 [Tanacetum coccineum]